MTTATNLHTWQGLTIPDCLQPVDRPTSRGIRLRLVRESDRRQWELILEARLGPKTMSGEFFMEHRRDEREIDLKPVVRLVESLPKSRGSFWGDEDSLSFRNFPHPDGLQLFAALMDVVAAGVQG